ncbi:GNAT family N-acetyltransferase [Rugamonas sp. CCM 8940]|uniref:GNAT family N-acetyltransferase n=1 Tax=Rugamonas sp. CCM 8940 TaxID=2765359 RepID=UPI0018F64B76|nr:GNAT family N-acetyltransferase [Rugamonas sp. CCM 8940]MBJ7313683.1 GNAT family N-acetyltransferase [Rugamonas sp. CCM 8940]
MKPSALQFHALLVDDVDAFHALRLAGMREKPEAFRTSYAEEAALPPVHRQQRLLHTPHQRMFGAWDGETLVGMVGLKREPIAVRHDRANLWGVYVAPRARGAGVARGLIEAALDYARALPELRRVTLMVNMDNAAARALYAKLGFTLVEGTLDAQRDEQMLLLLAGMPPS